jgi:hypothetical protein
MSANEGQRTLSTGTAISASDPKRMLVARRYWSVWLHEIAEVKHVVRRSLAVFQLNEGQSAFPVFDLAQVRR